MVYIPSRLVKASGIRSWVCNAPFQSFLVYFILFVYIIKGTCVCGLQTLRKNGISVQFSVLFAQSP